MAVITGYTAERMKAIEDTTVTSGSVNGSGSLILAQRGGAQIDAGNVKGPQGLQGIQGIQGIQGPQGVQAPAPPWTPNTVYAANTWVISPFGEVVKSKSARTSGASWTSSEAVNWAGRDEMMTFGNEGFDWSGAYASWDAGPLSISNHAEAVSQKSTGPAFAAPGAISGTLKFSEIGIFGISWFVMPNGNPGSRQISIKTSGTWPGNPGTWWDRMGSIFQPDNVVMWETQVYGILRVPQVNLDIRFIGQQSNSTRNVSSIRIHKLASI